jgi:putative phosphoesterase
MTRIGLLSDTHGYLDPTLRGHFEECDEIWHAGDIGTTTVLDELRTWGKPIRAVYGNIDSAEIRMDTVEDLVWTCEDVKIFMTHIAGYPNRYNKRVVDLIRMHQPKLVVCGHSHILKVIYDQLQNHLHINPGACGVHGLHQVRTAVRFSIDGDEIKKLQVIELGIRGRLSDS